MARHPPALRNLNRRPTFHGWIVQVTRGQVRRHVYVHDSEHGGRQGALREARRQRDRLEASLPPPVKLQRRNRRNETGPVGVLRYLDRTRAGTLVPRYLAHWYGTDGRLHKRSFSVLRYGEEEARRLAVRARVLGVWEYLRDRAAQLGRGRAPSLREVTAAVERGTATAMRRRNRERTKGTRS